MTETQETYAVVPVDTAMLPVDVEQAIVEWKAYQDLTTRLLDKTDYQPIGPKSFKKKSAWRKYAKAFNLSCEIIDKIVERGEDGKIQYADFVVRATAPSGRYAEAWASCSRSERAFSHDQDIAATAQTRAENRAISDLIGAGEVSAEEMAKPGRAGTQGAQGSAPRPLEPANAASDKQKQTIGKLLHEIDDLQAMEFCEDYNIGIQMKTDGPHYGAGIEAAGLTGGQHGTASQLIDALLPLVKQATKGKPAPKGAVEMADPREEPAGAEPDAPRDASATKTARPAPDDDIKTAGDLFTYCWKEYQMQRGEVFKVLGVEKVAEIVNPAAALKIVRHAKAKTAEPEQAALIEEE